MFKRLKLGNKGIKEMTLGVKITTTDDEKIPNVLVGRKKVEWIANNFIMSEHAKFAQIRRDDTLTKSALRQRILNSPLAWKTKNDCVAIALDLFNYIVVDPSNKTTYGTIAPIVVTFVNVRDSGINVVDKFIVEYRDFKGGW
jgi:hypothetical protein